MKRFILVTLFLSFFGSASSVWAYNPVVPWELPYTTQGYTFDKLACASITLGSNVYNTCIYVADDSSLQLRNNYLDYLEWQVVPNQVYYHYIRCQSDNGVMRDEQCSTIVSDYGNTSSAMQSLDNALYSVDIYNAYPPYNTEVLHVANYPPPNLAIIRSPELGGGVTIIPPDGLPYYYCGINGGTTCELEADYNSQVTLEAQASSGYAFSHWVINSQIMEDTDGTVVIPMSEDKEVVAVYKLDYLSFPLSGSTPYTASVSSVFDHSGNADYGNSDHQVTAFSGEASNVQTPYTETTCYPKSDSSAFGSGFTYQGYGQAGVYYLCYNGHPGYDYAVSIGTNVYSAAPGKVIVAEEDSCLGYNVTIKHDAEYVTRYFHLNSIDTSNVQIDQNIPSEVRIGTSGNTGTCSDGAHLHFQVEKNGIPVDPYGWTGGSADPYTRATNVTLWE